MTAQTENIIRVTAGGDPSISPKCLELAIKVLNGEHLAPKPASHDEEKIYDIVPYGTVCELLHIRRTTLHKLIRQKRLVRVMGAGGRGIGVTRKSLLRVMDGYVKNGKL